MIFDALCESASRDELMLTNGGFCNWHLRRDGQLTIREIISTRKGAGGLMLRRLERVPGATSLFAKCPVRLPSNLWYARRGFHIERMEYLPGGSKVFHWRKPLVAQHTPNVGKVELIYSSGGNQRFAEIACDAGWLNGSRLPETVYFKPHFADNEYSANPSLEDYETAVAKLKPYLATVLDWQSHVTWQRILEWCEAIAPHVGELIIIPKIPGTIQQIPSMLFGRPVRLGYSVPTSVGGTPNSLGEFGNRPVHLLGGSPEKQLDLTKYLNVVSADNNYIQDMANKGMYWTPRSPFKRRNNWFVTLSEADGGWCGEDANYEAFRRSCHNVYQAWRELKSDRIQVEAQLELAI